MNSQQGQSANSDPVAIVTGGGTGIGAACASVLASNGCRVIVNYRSSEQQAKAVVEECQDKGAEAIAVQGDIASDQDCRRVIDSAIEKWGAVDFLVNNAGTTRFVDADNFDALNKEDFDQVMSVNVSGAYQMTRAATPYLRQSDSASVVNVSSHSGFSGIGSSIAYAASKGALNTLTLSLARALAPDIRVNAVCPGFVDTHWMKKKALSDAEIAAFKTKVASIAPLKKIPSSEEVANTVAWFLLHAKSITGQLLVIDGGTHLTVGDPL
ncbi:MAG: SDR family oxidoreductase [Pseudomonadota bacterium]